MSEPSSAVHGVSEAEILRLVHFDHDEPHRILGAHPERRGEHDGVVIRAFHPDATGCSAVLPSGEVRTLRPERAPGFFEGFLAGAGLPLAYRLRFRFQDGWEWEHDDPYRFLPTLGDVDLHLFNEGTHRRLWDVLGAHPRQINGVEGTSFAVWAPNARRVSVVGDFCRWDGRLHPMRRMGGSGVFELFVPGVSPGAIYKFEIKTREGMLRVKSDPFAFATEAPPQTASRVTRSSYAWGDHAWMTRRPQRDWGREPMAIYEVHLGSWMRVPEEGNRPLSYREIAPKLVDHVKRLGFTHVEMLPIAEHPFSGSWGYQVTGYYAPTARYGSPDDFRFLVDHCHAHGIGVLLDWVPAHFPKDDWALRRFDGTALYEHDDPRQGEHPDWGTLIFNFDRSEVRNFLVANALYWLEEFHVDGLRVDAVASMLYLDYSRNEGEWIPNRYGGRENLGAIDFLKDLTETVRREQPGTLMIAEESTAWPRVTGPVSEGGLGFNFKWNMGWMHDTLKYLSHDPIHRRFHHDTLTFAMLYEYTERFINPLSHDEVVHMKGSLWNKMPGDSWQKFANLRLLLAYQFTRPGKKMLFMGAELGTWREWNHDASLDWHFAREPERAGILRFVEELGRVYHEFPSLWRRDLEPEGFRWIDCTDRDNSAIFYLRVDGDDHVVVALNFTPVPREHYRVGVPASGAYVERLSSDDSRFGGSGYGTHPRLDTEPLPSHGYPQSLALRLPPLGALVLVPERPAVPADPPDPPAGPPKPARKAAKRSPRKSE